MTAIRCSDRNLLGQGEGAGVSGVRKTGTGRVWWGAAVATAAIVVTAACGHGSRTPPPEPSGSTTYDLKELRHALRRGQLAEHEGRRPDARRHYLSVIRMHTRRKGAPGSESAGYAAQARFRINEWQLAAFLRMRLETTVLRYISEGKTPEIERIFSRARALVDAYTEVMEYKHPKTTVLCACRIGRVYDGVAGIILRGLKSAPVPDWVTRENRKAEYQRRIAPLIRGEVGPRRRAALDWYRRCSYLASKLKIKHEAVRDAARRVREIKKGWNNQLPASQPVAVPP